ncbi:CIC11C00000005454 [Sungouiella intermedia]|uniref:CIC11C00000005454 n=1 Tax=Sungouiella intermedia TaxID=45354 RepID=A0A1L0BPV2_9ASCO|nr:CIC11C00000005454 [[Candida] intermedia]
MAENLQKRKIKKSQISHCDRFGFILPTVEVDVCSSYHITFERRLVNSNLDQVIEKFVNLVREYPIEKAQNDLFGDIGDINNAECYNMTSDVLSEALNMVRNFRESCCRVRAPIQRWNVEVSKLANDSNYLNQKLREQYPEFQELYYVCRRDIRDQAFFLARTKFHKNMATHEDMMNTLGCIIDICDRLKEEIEGSVVFVNHSDRMTGILSRLFEYIRFITLKADFKCNREAQLNSNYRCYDGPHRRIKVFYKNVVEEMNIQPNADEILLNASKLLFTLNKVDRNIQVISGVLEEAYKSSLFPVQQWINGYIEKKQASLIEVADEE